MSMRLTSRIYLVGSGLYGFGLTNDYDCHVYLVDCGSSAVLVDSGAGLEVDRIVEIWDECLKQSGGPFLFGKEPCIADAFYAPVVSRFRTYSIPVSGAAKAYCDTIWAWPPLRAWVADAQKETLRAKFHED